MFPWLVWAWALFGHKAAGSNDASCGPPAARIPNLHCTGRIVNVLVSDFLLADIDDVVSHHHGRCTSHPRCQESQDTREANNADRSPMVDEGKYAKFHLCLNCALLCVMSLQSERVRAWRRMKQSLTFLRGRVTLRTSRLRNYLLNVLIFDPFPTCHLGLRMLKSIQAQYTQSWLL